MKLLAIDPGTANTGYALFENKKLVDAGLFSKMTKETAETGIDNIKSKFLMYLKDVSPDLLVVEDFVFQRLNVYKNGRSQKAFFQSPLSQIVLERLRTTLEVHASVSRVKVLPRVNVRSWQAEIGISTTRGMPKDEVKAISKKFATLVYGDVIERLKLGKLKKHQDAFDAICIGHYSLARQHY